LVLCDVHPQNLRNELKALKSAPGALAVATPAPAGMDVSEMTKEQLTQKLVSYQQFMAKYIVDSQQQKIKAVAAAELKIKQQYEEKLRLLSGSTSTAPVASSTPVVEASPAFEQRNAKVAAAAAVGKSRWGDMENMKAGATVVPVVPVNGVTAPPAVSVPSSSSSSNANFDKRNAMVAAAGQAGKSRWGEPEVAKASQASASLPPSTSSSSSSGSVSTPIVVVEVPPEVEAADHGLRADGGVGGPSLAERVNFGAQLVNKQTASAPASAASSSLSTTYYDKRNARITAAGLAGKSRWGAMEIHKVQSLLPAASSTSSSSSGITSPIVLTPEIEAADHGLRADGGVGGPSLAQRVNFGASLVNK